MYVCVILLNIIIPVYITTKLRSPLKPLPPEVGQTGEGEPCGLKTGANALFCFAAEGKDEKGRREEEELEPGIVGLDGITGKDRNKVEDKVSRYFCFLY